MDGGKLKNDHVEMGRDMIYKLDAKGYFLFMSESAAAFFDKSPEQIEGLRYTQLVRSDYRKATEDFYQHQIANRIKSTYFEFPIIDIKRKNRWVGQSAELVRDSTGNLEILATARDITAQKQTEVELSKSNFRLNALIKNLNSAILVENEERKMIFVNQKFCDFFQIPAPPEALIGMDCSESAEQSKHHFKDPDGFVSRVNEILQKREEVIDEQVFFANGRIMERDYIPVFSDNDYSGHMWQYRDITRRAGIEAKIRESEERYRSIIENINLGLLEVDLNQNILYANNSFCEITGYSKEELVGKRADDLLLPEPEKAELQEVVEAANAKRKAQKASAYELKLRKKNGEDIWVIISGAPIKNEKGEVIGSLGIHNDITKRKKEEIERQHFLDELSARNADLRLNQENLKKVISEKEKVQVALEDSEKKHRAILSSAMDAVITMNKEGIVIDWNKMAEETFGFETEKAIGKRLSDLIIPEKYREAHERGMQHFLKTGEGPVLNQRIEIVGRHKSGKVFPIELSIVPLQANDGWMFSAFLRNITDRKQSEEDMTKALEEQKKLSRMRSRFVSMTSHELRTPLTTIKSNMDLLQYKIESLGIGEKLDININRIEHEVERLRNVMTDILMLGKLEDGKVQFKPRATELVEYLHELMNRSFKPWEDGRTVEFSLHGPPRLVEIDKSLFAHVIDNLLSNAFKYSPGAEAPQMQLRFDPTMVEISISDSGLGIPEEDMNHIFGSFYRASNTDNISGTGMGLAIVKQFSELHGAELKVSSSVGRGSVFTVLIQTN